MLDYAASQRHPNLHITGAVRAHCPYSFAKSEQRLQRSVDGVMFAFFGYKTLIKHDVSTSEEELLSAVHARCVIDDKLPRVTLRAGARGSNQAAEVASGKDSVVDFRAVLACDGDKLHS